LGAASNSIDGDIYEVLVFNSELIGDDYEKVSGYLAHIYNLYNYMPTDNPYKFDGRIFGYQKLWNPLTMGGSMLAWYDAMDFNSMFLSASSVAYMTDVSGNGKDAAQGTGSRQLTFIPKDPIMNNEPTLNCPASVWRYLDTVVPFSVKRMYLLIYYGTGAETVFSNHNAVVGSPDGLWRLTGRTTENRVFDGNRDLKNFDYNGTTYRNGSTVNTNYQANGLPINAELFKVTSPSSRNSIWRLLANTASYTWWGGGFAEIIFTDGNEDLVTQQKIEGLMMHRRGLQSKLPVGHPYKIEPPRD
jgi:hypothetical protein